jgi:hypothetical protein
MSYRKINVNDESYSYSIGRSHVHIKGGLLKKPVNVRKDTVGIKMEWKCECCGLTLSEIGDEAAETSFFYAVTPRVVREIITSHIAKSTD